MRVWRYARFGCCGCGLYWHEPMATTPPIATIGIATATWRERLASKDISRGPRRCPDGGRIGGVTPRLRRDEIRDTSAALSWPGISPRRGVSNVRLEISVSISVLRH